MALIAPTFVLAAADVSPPPMVPAPAQVNESAPPLIPARVAAPPARVERGRRAHRAD